MVADKVESGGSGVGGAGVRFGADASKLQPASANDTHAAAKTDIFNKRMRGEARTGPAGSKVK
jgi:hypothetical protein